MKNVFITTVVFWLANFNSFSQFASEALDVGNYNCGSAYCLNYGETISYDPTNGQDLYFKFYWTVNLDDLAPDERCVRIAFHFSGVSQIFTAELYGPFSTLNTNLCDNISSYLETLNPNGIIEIGTYNDNLNPAYDRVLLDAESSFNSDQGSHEGYFLLKVTPGDVNRTVSTWAYYNYCMTCKPKIPFPCEDCITSFRPTPGKYMISAWVKEDYGTGNVPATYSGSQLNISFEGQNVGQPYALTPSGQIIDGWQRIEAEIEIPLGATDINIDFVSTDTRDCYFDDIRFLPYDGSMMSYVYDPRNLRLMAQLDERNYATLYEYDEEGKLIRVKKETERGIMTIQENRDNIIKKPGN